MQQTGAACRLSGIHISSEAPAAERCRSATEEASMRRRRLTAVVVPTVLTGLVAFGVAYRMLPAEPDVRVRLPSVAKYESKSGFWVVIGYDWSKMGLVHPTNSSEPEVTIDLWDINTGEPAGSDRVRWQNAGVNPYWMQGGHTFRGEVAEGLPDFRDNFIEQGDGWLGEFKPGRESSFGASGATLLGVVIFRKRPDGSGELTLFRGPPYRRPVRAAAAWGGGVALAVLAAGVVLAARRRRGGRGRPTP
jgi:hypothetical protein